MPNFRNILSGIKRKTSAFRSPRMRRLGVSGTLVECPNCKRLVPDTELATHGGFCESCWTYLIPKPTPTPQPTGPMFRKGKFKRCPRCGVDTNVEASPNTCTNCNFNFNIPSIKCTSCGALLNINEPRCTYCNVANRSYEKPGRLAESAGKRVSAKIYEVFIYVIAGILVWFVPPFFGLPSFPYLAFALMIFAPAYTLFPSERDILKTIEKGETIGAKGLLLIPKSAMKMIAWGLAIFQFFLINRLIALAIAFIFYFMLPIRYKTTQPYKMLEAWVRLGVGAFLAYLFFITFGGLTPVGSSFLWIGLAFFVTSFPVHIEEEEGVVKIAVLTKYGEKYSSVHALSGIAFFICMLGALVGYVLPTGFQFDNMVQMMFLAIWGLSLFSGIVAGPEGRPAMGILMVVIALFAFSSTYTGVVGQAIFGYWWPQVQSFSEVVFTPLGSLWEQGRSGISDAWLLLTNPTQYYNIQMQKQQVTKSVVKTGGTKQSIELSRFELFSTVLDPNYEPLLGTIELENKGEFNANYINLEIQAFLKNSTTLEETAVGSFGLITCSGDPADVSYGIGPPAYCRWTGTTYPTEIKFANFKFNKGDAWTPLNEIVNGTYVYGGNTVRIKANYDYNYNVNVSIPIEVIPMDLYEQLLRAKEITLQELTSEYSGGSVKATIYSQKQPVRNNEYSLIRVSLVNEGIGNITSIPEPGFIIYVPEILNPQPLESSTFDTCTEKTGFVDAPERSVGDVKFKKITCTYTPSPPSKPQIGPNEYKTAMFLINPTQVTQNIKTISIIATASYNYMVTKGANIQVAAVPFGT